MQLVSLLHHCVSLILMISVKVSHGANCANHLDIAVVVVVDATSPESASSFDDVKTHVKGIVSGFTIGQSRTRLALVSMSQSAKVVANFNAVNSLADFNAAVDSLTSSTDKVELSEGIKVTVDSVLKTARASSISRILILVKDRRAAAISVSDTAVLSRVISESAAVKALGAAIHAVGICGLWNKLDLEALYGTDYLLFKNKNKAMESSKSLNNSYVCAAACPSTSSRKDGLCYASTKYDTSVKVDFLHEDSVCRKEIVREFTSCSIRQACSEMKREISPCGSDGKVSIEDSWQIFDYRLQACTTTKSTQNVSCVDASKCSGQVADILFLLDKSGSVGHNFKYIKMTAITLIDALNVGSDKVRVGVMKFGTDVEMIANLGQFADKAALLTHLRDMSEDATSTYTFTHKALRLAREILKSDGRPGVRKFVFAITDGASSNRWLTFDETARLKNDGLTIYAIGIGKINIAELRTLTAPETETNMVLLTKFDGLDGWARSFTSKLCIQLLPPNAKMCDDSVFFQAVSDCVLQVQVITRTEYKYNTEKMCIKSIQSTMQNDCRAKCTDPVDGNEYYEGTRWTTLCHEFECGKISVSPFLPVKSRCQAVDGTCKDIGSPIFKCRDENGVVSDNCRCIDRGGKVTLVIDK